MYVCNSYTLMQMMIYDIDNPSGRFLPEPSAVGGGVGNGDARALCRPRADIV